MGKIQVPDRELMALIKAQTKVSEAGIKAQQILLAQRYKESYGIATKAIDDLYRAMGPEVSLAEAKKYKRLNNTLSTIETSYKKLTGQAINQVKKGGEYNFSTGARFSQYAIEKQAGGVIMGWGGIPVGAVQDAVLSEVSGAVFSVRLNRNAGFTMQATQEAITRGLISGDSPAKLARMLKDQYQSGFSDAMRVMRTEMGRNYSEGQVYTTNKADELGIQTRKRWISAIDDRTRDTHLEMDGEYADDDGIFTLPGGLEFYAPMLPLPGNNDPAEIINCRCKYIDEVVQIPQSLENARTRSKTFTSASDFEEWRKERGY